MMESMILVCSKILIFDQKKKKRQNFSPLWEGMPMKYEQWGPREEEK